MRNASHEYSEFQELVRDAFGQNQHVSLDLKALNKLIKYLQNNDSSTYASMVAQFLLRNQEILLNSRQAFKLTKIPKQLQLENH